MSTAERTIRTTAERGTRGEQAEVNHSRIAAEALRYRLNLVRVPLVAHGDHELEAMANRCVTAADPAVDGAIRRIATAWTRAGLDPAGLGRRWDDPRVDRLFHDQPELVDALDELVRTACRAAAA